jgi:hypothetical protein
MREIIAPYLLLLITGIPHIDFHSALVKTMIDELPSIEAATLQQSQAE